jgi:hypothetical protein
LSEDALRRLLGAALGNALRADRDAAVASQAEMLRGLKPAVDAASIMEQWRELASQTASSPEALVVVATLVPPLIEVSGWTFGELLNFALATLLGAHGILFDLVDPATSDLGRIIPRLKSGSESTPEGYVEWETRARAAIEEVLPLWLGGEPLLAIGNVLRHHRGAKARATADDLARRFAIQTAAGVAHGVSVICRVMQRMLGTLEGSPLASWLTLLPGCVREGFDDPDKLLLFRHLMSKPGLFPRVLTHRRFSELSIAMPPWTDVFSIDERRWALRTFARDP